MEDWLSWARAENHGEPHVTSFITDFIAGNEKWLDSPRDSEPGKVTPSRRSWERLSKALVGAGVDEKADDPIFYPLCRGYIGNEATIAFHSFVKTIDSQVTGEEILRDYEKVKKKVSKLGQEKQNILIEKVSDYVTKQLKTLDETQGKNLGAFMKDLPGELRVSAWSKLTQGSGTDNIELLPMRNEVIPGAARFFSAGRGITMPEPGRITVPHWITTEAEGRKAVQELAGQKVALEMDVRVDENILK